jgi:hypothetical protein
MKEATVADFMVLFSDLPKMCEKNVKHVIPDQNPNYEFLTCYTSTFKLN